MIVVGVDPGLSGAIAVVRDRRLLAVHDMPTEDTGGTGTVKRRVGVGLLQVLRDIRRVHGDEGIQAVCERVSAMPAQGAKGLNEGGRGVASTFAFGESAGAIRMAIAAVGFPVQFITPQSWKKRFNVVKDKTGAIARTRACELFPDRADLFQRVKDHNRAEAALIALHGWETWA